MWFVTQLGTLITAYEDDSLRRTYQAVHMRDKRPFADLVLEERMESSTTSKKLKGIQLDVFLRFLGEDELKAVPVVRDLWPQFQ